MQNKGPFPLGQITDKNISFSRYFFIQNGWYRYRYKNVLPQIKVSVANICGRLFFYLYLPSTLHGKISGEISPDICYLAQWEWAFRVVVFLVFFCRNSSQILLLCSRIVVFLPVGMGFFLSLVEFSNSGVCNLWEES